MDMSMSVSMSMSMSAEQKSPECTVQNNTDKPDQYRHQKKYRKKKMNEDPEYRKKLMHQDEPGVIINTITIQLLDKRY